MSSKAGAVVYAAALVIPKNAGLNYKRIIGKISMYKRSRISVKENKKTLSISITADDITALRASANSIIRDLQVIERAADVAQE